ncbi:Hypothetical protein ORPV_316 [Orpheovirus IHUMI-LCC2]|uniref:Uncharacterized protein n=1 Tax=Orpheovirus IHUMI-LCC2 TaxID=2023057 RepID=A0A2I2L3X6_9VIRU|nr:Hypothetical protein ORPV_316 [Orpheovirus IHUMI-LCC2]SNW62220.1 Hypothetical protein ORPV_316 [Orpheovirus IHUMI-LCC2]
MTSFFGGRKESIHDKVMKKTKENTELRVNNSETISQKLIPVVDSKLEEVAKDAYVKGEVTIDVEQEIKNLMQSFTEDENLKIMDYRDDIYVANKLITTYTTLGFKVDQNKEEPHLLTISWTL